MYYHYLFLYVYSNVMVNTCTQDSEINSVKCVLSSGVSDLDLTVYMQCVLQCRCSDCTRPAGEAVNL